MTSNIWRRPFLDPLHGSIQLDDDLLSLVRTPVVQRLRHVRLSNIDSIDMPAISNISRFEHVLGVAHLAGQVGFKGKLAPLDLTILKASALLHDWAITSFGHLVEEALQYVGTGFDHERRLDEILTGNGRDEIGGADLQILVGRETGIRGWAQRSAGAASGKLLHGLMDHIQGRGRMGRVISGDIDLDNIDNVYRMAFHMGLPIDRETPVRLARSMVGFTPNSGEPVFRTSAADDIQAWRRTRREVYQNLMLAERDFVGKLMMLSAAVGAFEAGEIGAEDWSLTDHDFVTKLLSSKVRQVKDTAQRWIVGELWECVAPCWMSGSRPSYPELLTFSRRLSVILERPCFVYGIKDKRERRLTVSYDDGSGAVMGNDVDQWLFGLGSSRREGFNGRDVSIILELAKSELGSSLVGASPNEDAEQASLF